MSISDLSQLQKDSVTTGPGQEGRDESDDDDETLSSKEMEQALKTISWLMNQKTLPAAAAASAGLNEDQQQAGLAGNNARKIQSSKFQVCVKELRGSKGRKASRANLLN